MVESTSMGESFGFFLFNSHRALASISEFGFKHARRSRLAPLDDVRVSVDPVSFLVSEGSNCLRLPRQCVELEASDGLALI